MIDEGGWRGVEKQKGYVRIYLLVQTSLPGGMRVASRMQS